MIDKGADGVVVATVVDCGVCGWEICGGDQSLEGVEDGVMGTVVTKAPVFCEGGGAAEIGVNLVSDFGAGRTG